MNCVRSWKNKTTRCEETCCTLFTYEDKIMNVVGGPPCKISDALPPDQSGKYVPMKGSFSLLSVK